MKKIATIVAALTLAGCATQTPHVAVKDAPVSQDQQIAAQKKAAEIKADQALSLKRKIAIGRSVHDIFHEALLSQGLKKSDNIFINSSTHVSI